MKVKIFAVTPHEYGLLIDEVHWRYAQPLIDRLRADSPPGWDYFGVAPMTDAKAIGRRHFLYEQTSETKTTGCCRARQGADTSPDPTHRLGRLYVRDGEEQPEPQEASRPADTCPDQSLSGSSATGTAEQNQQ